MATETTKLTYVEGAAASTPAASRVVVYAKADGLMYSRDDAGTETLMSSGPASGIPATIFDATGDLIVASAADTAARLAVGAANTFLVGGTTPAWVALGNARAVITAADYTSKSSTTFADLDATNLSLTITTGARKVLIGVSCTAAITAATQSICLDIDLDGARLGQTFGLQAVDATVTAKAVNPSFTFLTAALTAASHTFKVQYRVTGSSATFYASTGVTPFIFWVAEQPF